MIDFYKIIRSEPVPWPKARPIFALQALFTGATILFSMILEVLLHGHGPREEKNITSFAGFRCKIAKGKSVIEGNDTEPTKQL